MSTGRTISLRTTRVLALCAGLAGVAAVLRLRLDTSQASTLERRSVIVQARTGAWTGTSWTGTSWTSAGDQPKSGPTVPGERGASRL